MQGAGQTQPSTGLFGQPLNQSTAQPSTGTGTFGNLFGQKPAMTNAFGQSTTQPASTGFGTSLFGGSTLGGTGTFGASTAAPANNQPGPTLTASVAQPVQQNLPIFSLLQDKPRSVVIDPPPKKASNLFTDIPTRSPLGLSTLRMSTTNKLRGFGSPQSSVGLNRMNGRSSTLTMTTTTQSPLALSRANSKSMMGPEAFLSRSTLGSEGKPSPKKLVLDKKIDPSDIFGRVQVKIASPAGPKVQFNPQMSIAAREKEVHNPLFPNLGPTSPSAATASPAKTATPPEKDASELREGDYFVRPTLAELRHIGHNELSAVEGLVVGRKGFGEIHFLEPVNLTTLPRIAHLLGRVIQIERSEASVFPDEEEARPAPGEGVNVRSRIILEGVWPLDKATREPIKDENHPLLKKHVNKLKKMKNTTFEDYDTETGTWSFEV